MKLLGYKPGFINNHGAVIIISSKVGKINNFNLKINIDVMDSDVEKMLDSYDKNIEELIINQCCILGLLDLKKFTRLKKLVCSSNEIMHIINLPMSLEYLDISFNKLKTINLNNLINLKYLKCSYNELTQIDLPEKIEFFDCSNNLLSGEFKGLDKLTNLHTFICSYNDLNKINIQNLSLLKKIDITENKFKNIENFPDSIQYLNCSYNPGINLDFGLPEQLLILNCSNCNLTKLNNMPPNLKELVCSRNKIIDLDNLPCGLKILFCRENKLTNLDYLPDSIETLFVGNNKLNNLDNLNTGLQELECEYCNLSNLNNLPSQLAYLLFDKGNNIGNLMFFNNIRVLI